MQTIWKNKRQRLGLLAATTAVVVIAAIVGLVIFASSSSSQSANQAAQQSILNQIQVVITPEQTSTPDALPTPIRLVAAPVTTPTSEVTPTPQVAATPYMALNPMPIQVCSSCINVLLLGLDQRPGEDPNTARTDTMIVLSLNTETHTAGMFSIPRDLFVPLPNTNTIDRINAAMAYGGPAYAMQTVTYNTGIQIQHYVRINFGVVVKLVDLVGGIDVYVDQDINDPTYPNMNYGYDPFVISKGWHHMDGATALKYARTRHQTSDFYRLRRQQEIIMAIRNRVLSTNAVPTLLQNAPQILSALSGSIVTDMNPADMVRLLLSAKDIQTNQIRQVVVDESAASNWVTPQGGQVLLPNRERIRELVSQLFNLPAHPESIALQNGTSTKDLATSARTYLNNLGYNVVQTGDAQGTFDKSVIYDYLGSYNSTTQLASALGLPTTAISATADAQSPVDVLVILGKDYTPRQ